MQPGAWTTHKGEIVQIYDCEKSDSTSGGHGQVTAVGDAGFCVATQGGEITVQRVRSAGQKVSASQFASDAGLSIGDQLGS